MEVLDDGSYRALGDACADKLTVTKRMPEAGECTIDIYQPTSNSSYSIDSPFSDDELAFNVTGDEEIDEYTVSSSEGTIEFIDDDGDTGTSIDTPQMSNILMNGGPSEGNSDTITVTGEIVDVTGAVTATCEDTLRITRPSPPPEREPVRECRSLRIVNPPEAVNGVPTVTIDEDGYVNEELRIEIDADAGAVEQLKYASDNDTITFDGQNPYWVGPNVLSVDMNGGPDPGGSDVVSVWAVDPAGSGIQECNDGFVVQVERPPECPECPECPEPEPCPPCPECPEPEPCPPCPEDGVCPPCPEPEPCPPCPEPGEPEPTEPRPSAPEEPEPAPAPEEPEQPLRPGAPEQPKTGPGVLLYVIGAGVGGAILRRRKNRQ
jgi:hypothetical protein